VRLKRPHVEGHSSRLVIGSHGREIEVGRHLTGPEREQLARELRHHLRGGRPGG